MIYLALGAAALWFLVAVGRGQTVFKRREWRLLSGAFAVAAFAGGAYAALRAEWAIAVILLLMGLWLVTTARINAPRMAGRRPSNRMSAEEARSILGVGPEASAEEIQAAYTRLMRRAHPDQGGTTGLATQLNAARDRLLRP